MTKIITVMGLDPSLSNFGMSKGLLNLSTGELEITGLMLIEAPPDKTSKNVRQNSLDLERAKHLSNTMRGYIQSSKPSIICVEIPVGSQSARAMASYGICIGLLASITTPLIQVTPAEVKQAATGSKTATKAEMIQWASNTYPQAPWLTVMRKGAVELVAKNEHLADSVAAIHAAAKTDQFKLMITALQAL